MENADLNKIRHFKGSVADFKNYFDQRAGENTNAFGTPDYQGFNDVHPTRGANKSPHWDDEITEDTDLGHTDNEPGMLANDLSVIERYAKELGDMMKEFEAKGKEVDFPHWWQSKIILAKEYLVKAKHYLRAELEKDLPNQTVPTFEKYKN